MTQLLYETDFSKWALTQADALRNEEYADLDPFIRSDFLAESLIHHRSLGIAQSCLIIVCRAVTVINN